MTDLAVLRPGPLAFWFVRYSTGSYQQIQWGTDGDLPIIGAYDGDGIDDIGVVRPGLQWYWIIVMSSGQPQYLSVPWGTNGDTAIVGDYDGDGKADFTVFRPGTSAQWIIKDVYGWPYAIVWLGTSGDIPLPTGPSQ